MRRRQAESPPGDRSTGSAKDHPPRGLVILGSTGSIGQQALEIVRSMPEEFRVVGLAAGANLELLEAQAAEFRPRYLASPSLVERPAWLPGVTTLCSVEEMPRVPGADLCLIATVGAAGLAPTLAALAAKRRVALANKEVLVMAGEIVSRLAGPENPIIPVDSEHNAIWQCIQGEAPLGTWGPGSPIRRLVLTASGGALRDVPPGELAMVSPAQAIIHPNWVMGTKVTIDSATLMNKGFEVIEAHWLFGVDYDRIEVVLHRESIVHSLVEFVDGAWKAQLGAPDMRTPIQHALTYPRRLPSTWRKLDLVADRTLTFAELDRARYPCFVLALDAARKGGTAPAALSAADDVAVDLFIRERIAFTDIADLVGRVLALHRPVTSPTIDDVLQADRWARDETIRLTETLR